MLSVASLFLILSITSAFAAPSKRFTSHVVHESRSSIPTQWSKRASTSLDKNAIIPVRINLAQRNIANGHGHDLLMSRSMPDSPLYGQHMTAAEVAEIFAPSQESIDAVMEWLKDAGISVGPEHYDSWKGAVTVPMSIAQAEDLLHTEYSQYEHDSGKKHVACKEYSVPASVKNHVDFVMPTVHFDIKALSPRRDDTSAKYIGKNKGLSPIAPKQGAKLAKAPAPDATGCDTQITPACLKALYGINYTQTATASNSYGIVEYTPQSYIPGDLDMFAKTYTTAAVGYRPTLDSIDGGALQTAQSFDQNGESDLDLEYAIALTYPLKVTLYQAGDTVEGASFNDFLDALDSSYCAGDDKTQDATYPDTASGGYKGAKNCGGFKATNVVSTSYGYNEVDLTPAYEMRQCNEYMKLGLLGTTFVYSSGDYGVAGNGGECLTSAGKLSTSGTKFNPAFPSVCPYVTSVGATQVSSGKTTADPESAAEQVIYSGGGFSNVFPLPSYQSAAVKSYFTSHKPTYTAAQYNNSQTTRGFPDISANGVNYVVAVDGSFQLIYGTSASAPVVGSIFSLINDARIAAGKSVIGFVNPVLYANPTALNDIVTGGNQGCKTSGFTAVTGWDPVTGLGTPNFPKLLSAFLALP